MSGICQEIGLIEEIDRQVDPSEQKVSIGQGVQAMVLNALGFSRRALYLMPDYMRNKPVDVLIGPGLSAEDFNIATNELDAQKLSSTQMLENYTDQGVSAEIGFRFLKDPLFFTDSLFLKKPERIMG